MVIYLSSILLFVLIAAVSTIMIGRSKLNVEGNPEYDRRTSGNVIRLTSFYVIAAILGLIILLVILF